MASGRGYRPLSDDLVKQAEPLVVEAVNDRGGDRWAPQREPREAMKDVRGGAAHQRPARGGDPAYVEVKPPVPAHQQRKARQPVGPPSECRVELRRGVETGFVGLHDPQEAVSVERPFALDPFLVANDLRNLPWVAP